MKAFTLAVVALAMVLPAQAQYSARRLTRRIAPQTQPAPRPATPPPAAPAQPQAAPVTPQYPAYPYQAVAPAYPTRPADPTKLAAEKAKNDEKQFDYFKRRAEEGSDHAQYEIGIRYLAGRGTAVNEKLGREWLAKAAKNGNTLATRKLAELGPESEKGDAPSAEKIAIQKIDQPAPAVKAETKPAEGPVKTSEAK